MNDELATTSRISAATWLGLFLSLFGVVIIRQAFRFFTPDMPANAVAWRETLIWLIAAALLFLVRRGERLPFQSIGLGTSSWWKSILWGLVIAVACSAFAVLLIKLTKYGQGPASTAFDKLPLGLVTMIVLRAGIVEELFYRGYAIERLQALGLGRLFSAAIPLVIFAFAHWTGGAANILIALVLGAILAGFYLWRRDLVANIIGHFLVDFVGNVLPRLFA
jgi:membrane protease YdiL (CAAX protease family)